MSRYGECIYCDAEHVLQLAPQMADPKNDDFWSEIAEQHREGCEWVARRAFLRPRVEEEEWNTSG